MRESSIKKLSVVVPCFNEEANLKRFPDEVFAPLGSAFPNFEVVLIDDGSSDGSLQAMSDLQRKFPNTVVRRHEENRGLGAGLRTGFLAASGDAVLTIDGDLTFHPREFPALLDAYSPSIDCVMGSPFLGQMKDVDPLRKFLSWAVNSLYALIIGKRFSSVSSIFRLYRADKVNALDLNCESFDINAEILFKLLASGGCAVEVPVTLARRQYGVSKINMVREIKNHLKMFLKILRWKLHLG